MNKNTYYVVGAVIVIVLIGGIAYWGLTKPVNNKIESTQTQKSSEDTADNPDSQSQQQSDSAQSCERNFNNSSLTTTNVQQSEKFVTLSVENFGDIKIEVDFASAPKTSENFVKLAKSGFYNCLTFHRVAAGFVIQGGDPEGTGQGGPGYTIPAEIKLPHLKGAVAMARLPDQINPNRESSGSQFYIALNDLAMLDGQYTVFGKVVGGMDVVDKIGGVPITPGPFGGSDGAPQEKVTITKAVVSEQ